MFCTSTYLLDRGALWVQGVLGAACNVLFFWVIIFKERRAVWGSDKNELQTTPVYKVAVFVFTVAYIWTIDYTFDNASPLISASIAAIKRYSAASSNCMASMSST